MPLSHPLRFWRQYNASTGRREGRSRKTPAPPKEECFVVERYRTANERLADSGDTTSSAVRARTVIS